MVKTGLGVKLIVHGETAKLARKKRDETPEHVLYKKSIAAINKDIASVIKATDNNPELAIAVSRECVRFVMSAIPDPTQDQARALFLKQCGTLEYHLSLVKKPAEYLSSMKEQFGPNLNIRNYANSDPFNTIIKSQKQRLYVEGQGFNIHEEKIFCLKRGELLTAVEKAYNRLRDQALGLPAPESRRGLGR